MLVVPTPEWFHWQFSNHIFVTISAVQPWRISVNTLCEPVWTGDMTTIKQSKTNFCIYHSKLITHVSFRFGTIWLYSCYYMIKVLVHGFFDTDHHEVNLHFASQEAEWVSSPSDRVEISVKEPFQMSFLLLSQTCKANTNTQNGSFMTVMKAQCFEVLSQVCMVRELVNFQHGIKIVSFNVWITYFVWNFKGALWNSTQNILFMHWKMCSLLRSRDSITAEFMNS